MREDRNLLALFLERERSRIRTWQRSQLVLNIFLEELHRQRGRVLRASPSHILAIVERVNSSNKKSTKRLFLGIVRCWYRFLYDCDLLLRPVHPELYLKLPIQRPIPQVLWPHEVDEWFSLCRNFGAEGLVDLAMLELVYGCGLRAGELARLTTSELDLSNRTVRIRTSKNDEGRTLPLPQKTYDVLLEYLRSRTVLSELWVRPDGTVVTLKVLRNRIKDYYRPRLSFEGRISLQVLRHSYATHLLQNGASIRHIQKLLGHRSLRSTQVYTHVFSCDLRSQILKAHRRNRMAAGST